MQGPSRRAGAITVRDATWDQAPLILTVAPCGAEVMRSQNPAIPYTPGEIAAQALEAVEVGATVIHLHAREDDGRPTHRRETFIAIIDRIRARTDAICNVSTGGATEMTMEQRLESLEAGADMAGVEPGSLNFDGTPFVTAHADGRRVVRRARELGMALEVECFDLGHVYDVPRLLEGTGVERPALYNLVLGVRGGAPATAQALHALAAAVPPGEPWTVTVIGRHQMRLIALAMLLGADGVRVGLEDNLYLERGRLAASNAVLVRRAAEIARTLGRRIATIAEARSILGLPPVATGDARAESAASRMIAD